MARQGLNDILLGQLRQAQAALAGPRVLSDARVHRARKWLKSARATLRLLRGLIGSDAFRRTNRALRDVAAPLGAARDAAALRRTVGALSAREARAAPAARVLRRALERELHSARTRLAPGGAARRGGLVRLAQVERLVRDWPPQSAAALASHPAAVLRAVTATYRHGRHCYAAVRGQASDAALHEWRKQSKYLASELRLLRALRPRRIDSQRRRANRIADILGTDHDLALLRGELLRGRSSAPAMCLLASIDRRRASLQARALAIGGRLYRLAPREFSAQLRPGT
ncbi:MAG TPA: CHAD domain-containing protein [Steroidobacteraceae bacterium]|nr:CHAD domain-containing protein [Steroidobacteraceae bacterium]